MAKGKDNVGRRVDEDLTSTSFEEVLSCEDATRVITWLRPVGDSRADSFRKKVSFPPNVRVSFLHRGLILWTARMRIEVE